MKRLITLSFITLLCATFFQSSVWSDTAPDYPKVAKEQQKLIRQYNEFLDTLEEFICKHRDTDKDSTMRALAAIEYARNSDVAEKMDVVVELMRDGQRFDAITQCLLVDEDFEEIERLLRGDREAPKARIRVLINILAKVKAIRLEMVKNDVGPWDQRGEIETLIGKTMILIERQKGILGNLGGIGSDGGMTPGEAQRIQDELKGAAQDIADALASMGGVAGPAADAMGNAAGSMGRASAAVGGMGAGSGSDSGSGGGQAGKDAAGAMNNAINHMKGAKDKMDAVVKEIDDEIKKSGYDLKTLSQREKDIARRLSRLRKDAARAAGASSGASNNLGNAALKSRRAADKMSRAAQGSSSGSGSDSGSGGGSDSGSDSSSGGGSGGGAGGASKDQGDARDYVDEAIADLRGQMDLLKMILALENVEKSLKTMIRIQKEVNKTTVGAHRKRQEFEEKNSGRRFVFGRALRHRIMSARGKEGDLAFMADKLAGILRDENKSVFPGMLDIMHDDMLVVVEKLGKRDVGEETQIIEGDILRNLERLLHAVHIDLETLKERRSRKGVDSQPGSGGGRSKPPRRQCLPSLAEVKMLRILEMEVQFQTSQLAEAHKRRIAAIEADKRLSPAQKAQRKRAEEEQKVRLGRRLASKQARIQALTAELLEKIKKAGK